MIVPLIITLAIIAFAAAFHIHWALGGRTGYAVSLPQREDGQPVMAQRLPWWRPRSEERRVGKECGVMCRSRWSAYH